MAVNAPTNGHINDGIPPKITLYTNHGCPYAHRAHITLDELKLPFEEVIIDLNTPRPQWYLDINPRGLVPSIKYSVEGVYKEEIITESAIVAQFLADSFPSHLLPASRGSPTAPLQRARVNFFTDTWSTKVNGPFFAILALEGAERDAKAEEWITIIEKEIEPLLADAKPFFGGSSELTLAEVFAAPFVIRWYAFAKDGEIVPGSVTERLDALPNFGRWAKAVVERESVRKIWDEEKVVEGFKKRIAERKAQAGKK